MTKEELAKESYLYAKNSKDVQDFECGFDIAFKSYIAGAEPREKRIAELEAQNLQLLKEWRVMDKAKQKAELKVAELMGDVSTLEQDYKRLEAQIEQMKCCSNCKHSRTEYEHCRTNKHEKWEIKEK